MHVASTKYDPLPASEGIVSVPLQSPEASSGAVAVAIAVPAEEDSVMFAADEPNWPASGHGVIELTPIVDPG
jgi:hypothetical protein